MTGRKGSYGLRAAAFAFPFRGRWHGEAMTDEVPLSGELSPMKSVTERSSSHKKTRRLQLYIACACRRGGDAPPAVKVRCVSYPGGRRIGAPTHVS